MTGPDLRKDWDRLTPEQFREEQDGRLRTFIQNQVYPFSEHYREVMDRETIAPDAIRGVADLERFPFSTKRDIAPAPGDPYRPRRFILAPSKEKIGLAPWQFRLRTAVRGFLGGVEQLRTALHREYNPVMLTFTTGRTAAPTPVAYTLHDIELLKETGGRILDVLGADPAGRGINLFPYAPHLAFWQVYYCGLARGMLLFHTGGGKVMGTDGILSMTDRFRPNYLMGIPGYVYHLLRRAKDKGLDLSTVDTVVLGGDRAAPPTREKIAAILASMGAKDVRVMSVFGFTEARCCWSECPGGFETGFHLYPDAGIVEIVDPDTGKTLGPDETGEIVYTSLGTRGTAVIRYRTGDIAHGGITFAPCPTCGRTSARLSADIRRVSSVKDLQLTKIRGTLVDLTILSEALNADGRIEEWQVELRKVNDDPDDLDELVVLAALREGADEERVRKTLADELARKTEVRPGRIEFLPLKEITERLGMDDRLKEQRIVDLRPTPDAPPSTSPS